ncbi:ADP-ribosylglycohydrolase family protein [Protofrankia symbiont of Coriaria ruscifolia]|uniref:ADP-ribosylglycohydrolase family protein n=1 Tax=Protofrankia symbiont of Coriaria ruscifolia TaxID=1306542 RepID=UPI001F5FADC4|nr:ADP-ribosylglycohydrolase family protein [Protofrankia symbiont of Coriaria ruscifolia]
MLTLDQGSELSYRDRVRGCLLGGALGDALGAGIEFLSLDEIRRVHGPAGVTSLTSAYGVHAPITDDTQMTLFTADGLIRASVRSRSRGICHPPSVVWRAYLRWLATQEQAGPPVDPDGWLAAQPLLYAQRAPGNACLSGLRRPEMGTPEHPANPTSKGCGAVMRSAPFGLLLQGPEAAWALAAECAVLTHGHPSGYLAAAAFAWIINAVVNGHTVIEAAESALGRLSSEREGSEVVATLQAALGAAADGVPTPERVESLGAGWVAEEALAIAVYCAAAAPQDPRAALLAAVNHSGDSDSTGAICGNLVGVSLGENALPADWVKDLEGYDLVGQVADDLVKEIACTAEISDDFGAAPAEWFTRYPGS